jgi:hypothetical protein
MRFSLTALVRLVGLLMVLACIEAVGMGRLAPAPARFRLLTPPRAGVINGFVLHSAAGHPGCLDSETGEIRPLELPSGDRLDNASYAPWLDEAGECQIVGRWARRDRSGNSTGYGDFGLARISMPSGRLLNDITTDLAPASPPCWFPGARAGVVYVSNDGKLYRILFEGARDSRPSAGDEEPETPALHAVTWSCPPPGREMYMRDPVWSNDPRIGGRLIVSLSYLAKESEKQATPPRLWWLELSSDASAVLSAGPLTDPAASSESLKYEAERFPNVARTPDGRLIAVFSTRPHLGADWELRLGPIGFDTSSGTPVVSLAETRTLARNQIGTLTPFSVDGRYVFALLRAGARREEVARFGTELEPERPEGELSGGSR